MPCGHQREELTLPNSPRAVLVVEDEALLLITIADELRQLGIRVYEATNADAAIRLLTAHDDISLLFTDIDMPGSMDGLKLSKAVRDRWPPVKIIITSGKSTGAGLPLPDGVFIPKPYATSVVVTAMQKLLA